MTDLPPREPSSADGILTHPTGRMAAGVSCSARTCSMLWQTEGAKELFLLGRWRPDYPREFG